ncbi:DUF417 family protein [Streptomyces sp. TS71-3]|uniref:DUF417 family protein n=1 Tax=Streptomyces sp. TS71-3 TaxID=2733862 RepID=UPI001B1C9B26|nr:DUF417 family protein [Streptomyces sp. TS71-3]GHJ37498.1 hypothetical protein Sm713_31070 [Streptomyces sp. TS71-3]
MPTPQPATPHPHTPPDRRIPTLALRTGRLVSRYGLVLVLIWFGAGKYVKMDSRVLIEHSPLMSWIYDVLDVKTVAVLLGTMEIVAGVLLALRPLWPRLSALGSLLSIVLFLGTLSFLFTSPGVIHSVSNGLPVLSAQPGQFLMKDIVLMGVAIWTLGDAWAGSLTGGHETSAALPESGPDLAAVADGGGSRTGHPYGP